jgi:hypothetical protein
MALEQMLDDGIARVLWVRLKPDTTVVGIMRRSRVAANGRPLGRAGDLAVVRGRFAEHPSGLFADRPRQGAL